MSDPTPTPPVNLGPWGFLLPWLAVLVSGASGPVWRTGPAEIEAAVSKAVAPMRDDLKELRAELRELDKRTTRLEATK